MGLLVVKPGKLIEGTYRHDSGPLLSVYDLTLVSTPECGVDRGRWENPEPEPIRGKD